MSVPMRADTQRPTYVAAAALTTPCAGVAGVIKRTSGSRLNERRAGSRDVITSLTLATTDFRSYSAPTSWHDAADQEAPAQIRCIAASARTCAAGASRARPHNVQDTMVQWNDPSQIAPTFHQDTAGVRFAYRRFGAVGDVPLIFLQDFAGTLDSWDPAVVDGFARERPVILLDNVGAGSSSGTSPNTVQAMAQYALAFIAALRLKRVDLLGFSLGGFIAQVIAAQRPELVRRMILVGTGPEGGVGIANIGQVVAQARQTSPAEPRLFLYFDRTESSQRAGRAYIERQACRTADRDRDTSAESVKAQLSAIIAWGSPSGRVNETRLRYIAQPVLIVNGKNDVAVPAAGSFELFEQLANAKLILYPDSGHGSLFQYPGEFVRDGLEFLDG
jgi:pimeloyl-ACP methyl ester carboxylesterase